MGWQELKDDLARLDDLSESVGVHFVEPPIERVARRVLALYQPCSDCEEGTVMWAGVPDMCSRCSGTGVVPGTGSDPLVFHNRDEATRLARYLFGED